MLGADALQVATISGVIVAVVGVILSTLLTSYARRRMAAEEDRTRWTREVDLRLANLERIAEDTRRCCQHIDDITSQVNQLSRSLDHLQWIGEPRFGRRKEPEQ